MSIFLTFSDSGWKSLLPFPLLALAALGAARAMGLSRADCGLRLPQRKGGAVPLVCACAAAALAFELFMPGSGEPSDSSVFSFIWLCAAAPVLEELIFRGAVQGALRRFGGAALIQAVPFALMHGSPARMLYALVMGLLLGLLRERTGSVLPGCAVHILNNIIVFMTKL